MLSGSCRTRRSGRLEADHCLRRHGRAAGVRPHAEHRPLSVKALALGLPKSAWRTVTWREGTAEHLSSRFARVRVPGTRKAKEVTHTGVGQVAIYELDMPICQ